MKSTKVEIDRRVYEISKMMISGISNPDIVEYIREKNGVSQAQVYNYIERARKLILESTKDDVDLEVCKAQRRFELLYAKSLKQNQFNIALGAEKAICELRGLNRPQKLAVTDPTGDEPIEIKVRLSKNGEKGNGEK